MERRRNPPESHPRRGHWPCPSCLAGNRCFHAVSASSIWRSVCICARVQGVGSRRRLSAYVVSGNAAAAGRGWGASLLAGRLPHNNGIEALAVLAFLRFGGVLPHHRRWSEAVFVLLGVFAPLSSGLWMSQRRYVWVLFPAFILLARWAERPWIDRTIKTVCWLPLSSTGLFGQYRRM
jgi:hypothetical protein